LKAVEAVKGVREYVAECGFPSVFPTIRTKVSYAHKLGPIFYYRRNRKYNKGGPN